ncbi:MAG TPA: exodeoxyribonuclease III [Candidatus Fimadaptatus faecigallinarum]|uniref:Exodeoxyribonuclease III n=1 Tax=Candidatus Fimadaptatus faecigallinarum TaxID=2840814 RepID=A0A9D1S569_9FIRM|nr:exodeoxyribonuclease III [Candidatus Fimadaptatus faecigallinarum]
MKYASWNVNGLRACVGKGFMDYFTASDVDALCLQETKLQPGQIQLDTPGYTQIWHSADKKGYSGTAIFTRREPLDVRYGMGLDEHDHEGRLICAEFDTHFLVCVYTPNSQRGLTRLDYRMKWEDDFRAYLLELDAKKPVIACGDMNVAHQEIDIKNPATNHESAGFTDAERAKFTQLLDSGFVDTFRALHPDARDRYSWWSYMFHARERNTGWRIDYFLTSARLRPALRAADIHDSVMGSDHCPVSLEIDV